MSRAIDRVVEVLKFVFTGVKGAKEVVCSAKRRANTAVVANFMILVFAIYNAQVFRILEIEVVNCGCQVDQGVRLMG